MKKKGIILMAAVITAAGLLTACTNKKVDYLVLVNKYSHLPDGWEKNIELVRAKNAWNEDVRLEKETYKQYKKLANDLKKDGVIIVLDSVYRSVKQQQELWNRWSKDSKKGIEYAKKYAAVPGYSEHHTGLAVDIVIKKDGKLIEENEDMIEEKEIFKKIHKTLAKYGFILRYLEGRDDITGYTYEPWHIRYIGSEKIAKEIMDKNITLEEYLESIKDIKSTKEAAKYQIEKALQEYFKEVYGDKITNSRFNVTKIYTAKEEKKEPIKSLKLSKKDVAFEVTYELEPSDEADTNELTIPDGNYDKKTGWVKNISRLGVLKYDKKSGKYSVENFGTGW